MATVQKQRNTSIQKYVWDALEDYLMGARAGGEGGGSGRRWCVTGGCRWLGWGAEVARGYVSARI
jgi:hypothetical protein